MSGSSPHSDADVSRETSALRARFADVPGLERYAEILATVGVERGLIGPREVPRIWGRHIANCAVIALEEPVIASGSTVVDVGSGAGLPGLVWALVRPDLHVTLLEPLLRRATFLSEVVAELQLDRRVQVERGRAESASGVTYDIATARAVARLPQLLEWTLPLTRHGGWVVAMKGSAAADELAEAATVRKRLGAGPGRISQYGLEILQEPTTAVLVQRV